jgi:predicted dehydrogenase
MPDDRIVRFGIIGAVGRGGGFVGAIQSHPNARLTAMCDIAEDRLRAAAAEVGVEHTFTDATEMLDSGAVDAVIVGTPMPLHVPQSHSAALERGISVLSEVPAARLHRGVPRAGPLTASRSKAKYMMAENYCYIRSNVLVRELVAGGAVRGALLRRGRVYPRAERSSTRSPSWRRQVADRHQRQHLPDSQPRALIYQWMEQPARGGGLLCTAAGHHYQRPTRATCTRTRTPPSPACRLDGGGLVNLSAWTCSPTARRNMTYYTLQGTDGCYEAPRGLGRPATRYGLMERHEGPHLAQSGRTWPRSSCPRNGSSTRRKRRSKAGHGGGDYMAGGTTSSNGHPRGRRAAHRHPRGDGHDVARA